MGICYFCGKEVELPFRCPYCNLTFCDDHRLPEQHNCVGLPDRGWDTYRLVQRGIRNQASVKKELVKKEMKKPYDEDVIILGESMGDYKCALCGEEEGIFYKCLKCGEIYCWKHRKPTWHSCSQRRKKPPLAQEVKKTYTPKARLSRKHIVVIAVLLVSSIVVFSYLSNQEVNNDIESIIGVINDLIRTTSNTIYETFLKNITIPKIEFSSSVNHTEIERLILKYTNIERKNKGLKELEWDEKLSEIAREHSIDIVENHFFNHTNLEGARARAQIYKINGSTVLKFCSEIATCVKLETCISQQAVLDQLSPPY